MLQNSNLDGEALEVREDEKASPKAGSQPLLSTYYMLDTILGAGNTAGNKIKTLGLKRTNILTWRNNRHNSKHIIQQERSGKQHGAEGQDKEDGAALRKRWESLAVKGNVSRHLKKVREGSPQTTGSARSASSPSRGASSCCRHNFIPSANS